MAHYLDLGDGSFEIIKDDGSKLRTAMDPAMFGLEPAQNKPEQVAQFDAENTVAKGDAGTGGMFGRAFQPAESNPVADSIGQPGTQLVDRAPPKTIAVTPPAPQQSPQSASSDQSEAMKNLVASQIVQTRQGRAGTGKPVPVSQTVTRAPTPTRADVEQLGEQEMATEGLTIGHAEEQAQRHGALLDQQVQRNEAQMARLAQQFEQRKAVDAKLLELQTHAETQERNAAEMQTLSPTDEFFKNAGGPWARVLAGLMTMLGGLGQAHSAAAGQQTPNQAMQAIQAGIKERADMLRQQHEQAEAAGRTARNAYSDMLQMYGTPELAMQALNDRGEMIADRKLAIMAEKEGNQEKLQQVYQWQAQRAEARAARMAERNAAAAGSVTTASKFDQGSPGGAAVNPEMIRLWNELNKSGQGGKALNVRLPDGSVGQAQTEGAAKEVQERVKASNQVADAAARIRHLMNQPGAKTDPKKRAQIETALKGMQLAIKRKETLGTLDKGSVEFLEAYGGNPIAFVDFGGAEAKLTEIEQSSRQEIEDAKRFDLGIATPPAMKSDE